MFCADNSRWYSLRLCLQRQFDTKRVHTGTPIEIDATNGSHAIGFAVTNNASASVLEVTMAKVLSQVKSANGYRFWHIPFWYRPFWYQPFWYRQGKRQSVFFKKGITICLNFCEGFFGGSSRPPTPPITPHRKVRFDAIQRRDTKSSQRLQHSRRQLQQYPVGLSK